MSSPAKSRIIRRCVYISAATIVHAGLAVLLFFSYIQHAMEASHGVLDSSVATRISQHLRVILLYPIYMPLLQADLLPEALGPLFLLLNSFIWVMAAWGLLRLLRLRRHRTMRT